MYDVLKSIETLIAVSSHYFLYFNASALDMSLWVKFILS